MVVWHATIGEKRKWIAARCLCKAPFSCQYIDACKCDHSIPLRVWCLLCFASAIIMSACVVCRVFLFFFFIWFGWKASGRANRLNGRRRKRWWRRRRIVRRKRQRLSVCISISMMMAFVRLGRQTSDTCTMYSVQCTQYYTHTHTLYVHVVSYLIITTDNFVSLFDWCSSEWKCNVSLSFIVQRLDFMSR